MTTEKINKQNVKMIAHRGLSGIEKENTNAAFIAAGNRTYWGIETDIHTTKSGVFAVIHDDTTARVANVNMTVEESSYDELFNINLTDTDGISYRSDLRIPRLEEYISICAKYDKIAVLELKKAFIKEDIERVISIINELGYIDKTIFISFNLQNLIFVKELMPNQQVQYLTSNCSNEEYEILIKYKMDIDYEYVCLTKEIIDNCHKNGIKVNCWTCDDKKEAEKLISFGIDFITTNILE